ncbi:sensor histidine kinase [Mycobacteroides abscessus]|uniref:sensor histidine kinase n=1 Tax=Mycobacteroides abscessus TaxID=36809 RepID=UPI00092C130F|nr:ATP-binding protein [Mycobacteroides abscessus]SHS60111.1 Sensor-like histidine kinase senX3 [Mycobacteroides abscessus subsp. abscessus]SHT98195.1 Sensor-like histidine kinase senX3 [Mycobacteroides abscessus subsp. abscessus]SHW29428.1 Sensor-like histidine kinase senX3 [Mycobacteroides abscessus subsp. abscessus]SIA70378.1 Sensor-like histidine kinase senX3 [Mycobacteroides abscessus subsp. abscessus]SIE46934.1 Sensor-like histidine kinase senX3 [Mycobacteroides abscessus subsp. abscessu
MTAASALLVATAAFAALAVGAALGVWYSRRASTHRNASEVAQTGLTVSQMLERIVAISPTGIVVVDKHQDVVLVNARARELGLVRDRRLDEQAWNAAQRTLATGEAVEVDLTTKPRAPGRAGFSLRGHVRRLSDADTRWVVIYVDDDSEHVRMEATRRDFVANVSHELKTPVGAMGVLAEALLESSDDPETVRHFGEQVLAESRRLGNMVTELIALSRLQGAEKLPDLEVVDVDFVVSEALSRSKVAAENADIAVTTDAPSGFEVRGDPTLLITAISNLVANAIAYSPQGSPVSISRRRRGDKVEIAVTDRGIGIAKEHQERVFERFFRVDKARSRDTGGTGLGLAIVKHVAANHNGVIKLWSQPGTGSTFTLSLPVYEDDVDDDDAEDTQADSPTGDTTPRKDATNHPPRPHGLPASGSSKADGLLTSTPPADGLRIGSSPADGLRIGSSPADGLRIGSSQVPPSRLREEHKATTREEHVRR